MADRTLIPGKKAIPFLVRRFAIGLGMVSILVCSILGSGIVTVQEGVPYVSIQATPAWTPTATGGLAVPPLVLPSQTPTSTILPAVTSVSVGSTPGPDLASRRMATPTRAFLATATLSAAVWPLPTATIRVCPPPASWRSYVVRLGETLTQLAWRHRTSVAAIMQANCMQTTAIFAGQRLYLPPVVVLPAPTITRCVPQPPMGWVRYIVRQGDTLSSLAMRYRTTLVEIQRVNCLSDYRLFAGQQIYLPVLPPLATPTWTLAPTSTTMSTVAPTATVTPTIAPTATEVMETPTPTATLPISPTGIVTLTPTWTATATEGVDLPTPTATGTPTPTPTATEGADNPTPTATASLTATETVLPTATVAPSSTATTAPTLAGTSTATSTAAPTALPTATSTPVPFPTDTAAPTQTPAEGNLF